MKRLLVLGLVLLLLAGCGKQAEDSPETSTQQSVQPDPGWYISNSEIERSTKGAIRMYNLPVNDVYWIKNVGSNLLLATEAGFTVLTGENCVASAAVMPETENVKDVSVFQFTAQGVAYYLAEGNEIVYLDQRLEEISRIQLPEKPEGNVIITPDGGEVFYCIGDEIRAYDTNRNITRPVKKQLVQKHTLTGALFGGKILVCGVVYTSGEEGTVYLDSQTGETRSTDARTVIAATENDAYFAVNDDGLLRQEIFGARLGEPAALDIPDDAELIPAVALNGVVGVSFDAGKPVRLSFYDFRSGCITGAVKLSGVDEIVSASVDKWSNSIWLLVKEENEVSLLKWTPGKSAVDGGESYKTPVYTPENPDEEGLSACNKRVKSLNKTYGVEIRLWKDAVAETGEYTVVAEHRPAAINVFLDELEAALKLFPDKFLRRSATRPLQICVVRNIDGGKESVQFYKNTNAYIFLSTAGDVKAELIRGLGYVVNSRVVSNSPVLDTWTKLNPSGFAYGKGTAEYLTGENRAFADEKAMTSVVEDRSSIFRYAMEEGNEEIFASKIMQKKLTLLCKGIRKVWKWNKEEVAFPWEQYLKEPLAYVKK